MSTFCTVSVPIRKDAFWSKIQFIPSATEFHIEYLTLRIIPHYSTYKIEDIGHSSIISLHRKLIASHDLQTWLGVVGG